MSRYYIYQNWTRSRGRIHRAECPYCNHGKGTQSTDSGKNGKWNGFDDRDRAFAAAKALVLNDMKPCATCAP
jgi:hypothetical protein